MGSVYRTNPIIAHTRVGCVKTRKTARAQDYQVDCTFRNKQHGLTMYS